MANQPFGGSNGLDDKEEQGNHQRLHNSLRHDGYQESDKRADTNLQRLLPRCPRDEQFSDERP